MAEQILDKENGAVRIGLGPALSMLASNVMADIVHVHLK